MRDLKMEPYKVIFDDLEWQVPSAGVRSKIFREGNKQLRFVEFSSKFVEHEWCHNSHIGMILKGELEIDFQGRVIRYPEGSCLIISDGQKNPHKARTMTPVVQVFLIEDNLEHETIK